MSSRDLAAEEEILAEGGEVLANVDDEINQLRDFAQKISVLQEGEPIPNELVQQGMTALVRLYTVKFQLGERWEPFNAREPMPATAVMIMATAMLRNVNVEMFELGLWQSWSGA